MVPIQNENDGKVLGVLTEGTWRGRGRALSYVPKYPNANLSLVFYICFVTITSYCLALHSITSVACFSLFF